MLYAFYFLATVVIWLGILSLRGGFRFASYVHTEVAKPLTSFTPYLTVFAPCRGLEDVLEENISALFTQAYPAYEIIFISDQAADPALELIGKIRNRHPANNVITQIVIAGPATDSGQKVHNLRAALPKADARSEVFVFVDTDARPQPTWLRSLVAPLADEKIGAASGYRWFVPINGGLAAHLRSVWNASIASALGKAQDKNFCWGGSTAIRRSTFDDLQVSERWRGSVSDDFTMTRALQEAQRPIYFVPACLVPAFDSCSASELIEFTNRQLKITRVYAPHLWRPVLLGSLLFCFVFFESVLLVITRIFNHRSFGFPLALIAIIYLLGTLKAEIRLRAVAAAIPNFKREVMAGRIYHLVLWPFTSALYLANAIVAFASRRIKWRGITYELKSPSEAVIIARE
jgi:cellulose synthase/poly-beta-1,6-N-acetylglucosamine synthase-like glycosyltransferase